MVPELAQNMTVSEDGLTYLFMIREDARWSDGEPVTADDFVFAMRRAREEGTVTAFLLDDIEDAEALDDWTLQLRLRAPRNYFPYVLASHWAYPWPRHRVEADGVDWRDPASLVGNGPMVLRELGEDGAVLGPNPHWPPTVGNVGEVVIAFRGDQEANLDEWRAGRHDVVLAPVRRGMDAPDTVIDEAPQVSTTFLGLAADNEPLDDVRVRLAIAHAIDRDALLAATRGIDVAAGRGGLIPPAMPGHGATAAPAYDPERARALLEEAGYPGGAGLPELRVSAQPWRPGDTLVEQLAAVGIPARVHVPQNKWGHEPGCHVWLSSWHADYPDPDGFFLGLLRIEPFHADAETEALLEAARASQDRDERMRLFREFERLWIGERAALVPLSYERQPVLRRPWVRGLSISPMRVAHLERVTVEPR